MDLLNLPNVSFREFVHGPDMDSRCAYRPTRPAESLSFSNDDGSCHGSTTQPSGLKPHLGLHASACRICSAYFRHEPLEPKIHSCLFFYPELTRAKLLLPS